MQLLITLVTSVIGFLILVWAIRLGTAPTNERLDQLIALMKKADERAEPSVFAKTRPSFEEPKSPGV